VGNLWQVGRKIGSFLWPLYIINIGINGHFGEIIKKTEKNIRKSLHV
jgi:hypothetical protein